MVKPCPGLTSLTVGSVSAWPRRPALRDSAMQLRRGNASSDSARGSGIVQTIERFWIPPGDSDVGPKVGRLEGFGPERTPPAGIVQTIEGFTPIQDSSIRFGRWPEWTRPAAPPVAPPVHLDGFRPRPAAFRPRAIPRTTSYNNSYPARPPRLRVSENLRSGGIFERGSKGPPRGPSGACFVRNGPGLGPAGPAAGLSVRVSGLPGPSGPGLLRRRPVPGSARQPRSRE